MRIVEFGLVTASCALLAALVNIPVRADQNASAATTDDKTTLSEGAKAEPSKGARINIYGYAEGGYFHDFSAPGSPGPTYVGYNNFKNEVILDKISLNVERPVDPARRAFDVGFHVEGIYGADAAFIHSNGLMDAQTGRNQWDLLQGYLDVTFPGLPLRLRVGKWIELAGFEHFSANIYGAFGDPARALYSYSYQFLYAEPGTQTGALATFVLNRMWTLDAGVTRGWNQSTRDGNHALDFLGRVTFTPSDRTSIIFLMTEGPEFPTGFGKNLPPGDDRDWWTALDLVLTQNVTGRLKLGLGCDYINARNIPGLPSGAKQWGGVAGYASYAIDPHFTLNTRLEWYKDAADGFSTGANVPANCCEATVGAALKPFPRNHVLSRVLFRPEVRYDRSDRAIFDAGRRDQLTFSVDALFTF